MSSRVDAPAILASCIAELLVELRPDIPQPVALSFAVEALDKCADLILDEAWARRRAELYPQAVAAARSRNFTSYAAKRLAEAEAAKPKPGDFPGRREKRGLFAVFKAGDFTHAEEMCDFGPSYDPFWKSGCGASLTVSPEGCGEGCRAVNRKRAVRHG